MKTTRQHFIALVAAATVATAADAQINHLKIRGGYEADLQLTEGWTMDIVPASEVMQPNDIRLATCWATCDIGALYARPQDPGLEITLTEDIDLEALVAQCVGDDWRLPTLDEAQALISACQVTNTTIDDAPVVVFTLTHSDLSTSTVVFPFTQADRFVYPTSHINHGPTPSVTCIVINEYAWPRLEDIPLNSGAVVSLRPVSKTRTQQISLESGWNWISLNVLPQADLQGIMATGLTDGDCIRSLSEAKTNEYANGRWSNTGDNALLTLGADCMYQLKAGKARTLEVKGTPLTDHSIDIRNGWNHIAYDYTDAVDVNLALINYPATEGDIIKGIDKFAVFENDIWTGTLTHLEPGHGYMLFSQTAEPLRLQYAHSLGALPQNARAAAPAAPHKTMSATNRKYASNMTAALRIEGIRNITPDMRLVATVGGEVRGETTPVSNPTTGEPLFMLTLSGDQPAPVRLTLYDGATELRAVSGAFTYTTDKHIGSLDIAMGIQSHQASGGVYPSPFSDELHIAYTPLDPTADVQVAIANATGQTIDRIANCNLGGRVDITWPRAAAVPCGAYIVTIYENGIPTQTHKTLKVQ